MKILVRCGLRMPKSMGSQHFVSRVRTSWMLRNIFSLKMLMCWSVTNERMESVAQNGCYMRGVCIRYEALKEREI